ncbi:ATP-binding cassette domain-containing protein [Paraclostridium sp. AKS46]|nr:ATP-binding cassette domain-containing protein [Paraclostridium sp. AKS46]
MKLDNYSLKIGRKILIENVSLSFEDESVNHLLGGNGAGKSCFAKSLIGLINHSGSIEECDCDIVLISSKSNIPLDLKLKDILIYLEKIMGKIEWIIFINYLT